ncbi:MAG TPA: hypothetical protein VF718_15270 [Allosphingosinicella sp.]|jgi:hypothetical protein
MIRKLIVLAVVALIAAPLVSLHQLGAVEPGASVSLFSDEGGLVFILEVRGFASLEPLLAAVAL